MSEQKLNPESASSSVNEEPGYLVQEVRRLRLTVGVLAALLVVFLFALLVAWPRSIAYTSVLEENLSLKVKLQQIDRRMTEIDHILLRLRLYDAQMDSLASPKGEHGPLPESAYANGQLEPEEAPPSSLLDGQGENNSYEIRPAASWADGVIARADNFLDAFASAEPDLNRVMSELEELRALGRALPSVWPAEGKLTSGFGWRHNPFGGTWKFHSGLDIAGKRGTPIYSPARGTVSAVTQNSGYGRMLEIDHGFGITSIYAHCNSIKVREGSLVKRGDLIGTIGNTGRSTGPHLHFEVRLDDHPIDPMDYLPRE
jgi:murein DD-endopeptidase MepM/ murein hydrolase activator NlpD